MRSYLNSWSTVLAKLGYRRKRTHVCRSTNHGRKLRFEQCEDRRMLATFTVNSIIDPSTFSLTDSEVSLREAVFRANEFTNLDTIDFAASLNDATITLTQGQLSITNSVTIKGTDANGVSRNITIDGANGTDHEANTGDGLTLSTLEDCQLGCPFTGGASSLARRPGSMRMADD